MASIEAKPTEYKGTLYRSRLEARWAVYLGHHPKISKFDYEPDYVLADFYVCPFHTNDSNRLEPFLLQIKPTVPSQDYLRELQKAAFGSPVPYVLAIGSFFDEEPLMYLVRPGVLIMTGTPLSRSPLGDNYALVSAAGYRFDLAQPEKPRRKGKKSYGFGQAAPKKRKKRRPF